MEMSDSCLPCSTNTEKCPPEDIRTCPGHYAPFTCGQEQREDESYSVYCNARQTCMIFNGTARTDDTTQRYSYFGCTKKKLHSFVSFSSSSGMECLSNCSQKNSTGVLMKPWSSNMTDHNCVCLQGESLSVTMRDMSSHCEDTWSTSMPGPTGARSGAAEEGWALFSTLDSCVHMSALENFYSDSPGKWQSLVHGGCDVFSRAACQLTE